MRVEDWEVTIQKIVDECSHAQKKRGEVGIVMKWRAKLEKEPALLKPFQIDQIMREVRRRLG